jgi:hypothetical protein
MSSVACEGSGKLRAFGLLQHSHARARTHAPQVAPFEGAEVKELVCRLMEAAGPGLSVPLKVNMVEGQSWADVS